MLQMFVRLLARMKAGKAVSLLTQSLYLIIQYMFQVLKDSLLIWMSVFLKQVMIQLIQCWSVGIFEFDIVQSWKRIL
ncbi:hypothetical protein TO66_07260 [Pseudomonas sp. MRSN 12121]|nr:hypothetical protein TO66_07260 [Pseudomonas sp. MRSN 12121]